MTAPAFDTYAAAKTLREAGFDERQAEAAVVVMRDAITEGVATKAAVARLDAKITRLEDKIDAKADKADLKNAIAELRADLYRALWIQGGTIVVAITALAGIAFALAGLIARAGAGA